MHHFFSFQAQNEHSRLRSITLNLSTVIGITHRMVVGENVIEVILDNGYHPKVLTYGHVSEREAKRFYKELTEALNAYNKEQG